MKSTPLPLSGEGEPLTRLSDVLAGKAAAGLSPLEQQAAALLSKMPTPTPLSPKSLDRIGEAFAKPPASPTGWLIGGGVGLAVVVVTATALWPRLSGHEPPRAPSVTMQSSPTVRPEEPPVLIPAVVPLPSAAESQPEPARPSTHSSRKHVNVAAANKSQAVDPGLASAEAAAVGKAAPSGELPAEESALAIESRMLGLALRELRQTHDAKQALVRLDEYAARFPSGLLKEEAQAARVDALLLLGRRGEALGLLEQTTFTRLPRGGELTVLRGELRAASGRCRDALSDFAASGGSSSTAEVAERGLYGQGMCRAHLGDLAGAESDLRAYLARFPAGRFRASAQATLRNLTGTP